MTSELPALARLMLETVPSQQTAFIARTLLALVGILLIVFPVLLFLIRRPDNRRDQIVAALLILVAGIAVALVFGGWQAAVIAIIVAGATILAAGVVGFLETGNADNGSSWSPFQARVRRVFVKEPPAQVIDDGKTVAPEGDPPSKPHRIVVSPYNAVIMQKGSYRTRISGPREFQSQDSEAVKYILDLREKQAARSFNAVETRDGALVDIYASIEYCIPVNEAAKQGRANLSVSDMRAIEQIAGYSPGMEQLAADEVGRQVRKVFKAVPKSYLDRPEAADHLGNRIQHRADEITRRHGVHILRVCLESVQVRPWETDQPEGTV